MLALVTSASAIDVDSDLALLRAELPDAAIVVWDDDAVDWSGFDAVIIRSTWDYHHRRDEFVAWAARVDRVTALWNPLDLIEWNTDKRYLTDLAARGIPTVPTEYVEPGNQPNGDLTGDLVVKPTVGASSTGVFRNRRDPGAAQAHIDRLHAGGSTAMVQPYLTEIDTVGETGLVYVGGVFSHAFRKQAVLADREIESDSISVERSGPRTATGAERTLGNRVMSVLPATAYARIDMLPSSNGPVLLEAELTEPSLFLEHHPEAAARAAAAFRSLVS